MSRAWAERGVMAVAVIAALWLYGCERERAGEAEGQLGALRQQYAALSALRARVDTQYVRDTVRLTRVTTRYETLRDSVLRVDTARVHDTTFIRVVASADTALKACRDVITSCELRVAVRDSLLAVDRRRIRALESSRPSFLRRWTERIAWGAVGYTVGSLTR